MMSSLFQKVTYMLNQLFQAVMNPPLFVMKKNIFSFVVLLTKQINTLKLVLPFTADDKSPARVYFFFPLSLQKEEQWPKRYFATTNRRKKSRWMWFNTLCNFLHGQLLFSAAKSIWLALYMYNIAYSREEKVWSNLRKKSNIQDDVIQWVSYKNKTGPQHLRTPQRTECQQMDELHGSSDITR